MLIQSRVKERSSGRVSVWLAIILTVASVAVTAAPAGAAKAARVPSGPQLAAAKQCTWAGCAQVLSAVAAGTKQTKVPSNLSPSIEGATSDLYAPPGMAGCVLGQPALVTSLPCVYNASATGKRMVLIGDSHAEMFSPAIANIAAANGYSLLFLAKIPCPLPMISFWTNLTDTSNTQCTKWKQWAFGRIQQFNPSIVIATTEDNNLEGTNQKPISQSKFSSGLLTTLKDLSAPGRRVILLGDIPYLSFGGPECLAAHETSVQSCNTSTSQAVVGANQAAQQSAASKSGATFIDVIPWMCTRQECPAIIHNICVYHDGFHITATFAKWLEPVLSEAIGLPSA
jgi:hypothetical protein